MNEDATTRPPLGEPIGTSAARPDLRRLLAGRGRYLDDISLPRMAHVAFVRSPYAHARILKIDATEAATMPGVVAVVTGSQLAEFCEPWVGVLDHLHGLKSPPQHALAVDRACWQGEAVVAVVASSRVLAEDAANLVEVDWEELPLATNMTAALESGAPPIHPDLGDNLAWRNEIVAGDPAARLAEADVTVEETFRLNGQTAVSLETRGLIADFNPADASLTVHHSTQVPHIMKHIFAKHLRLDDNAIRVICPDVGGSFGLKLHVYGDEMATAALSVMLKRPVKFVADRLESFVGDIHCRDHIVKAKIGLSKDGSITAMTIDDLMGIGPYSVYPRTSVIEGMLVTGFFGAPYHCENVKAESRAIFQNKAPKCSLRGVGMPIACTVTEGMVDRAARAVGIDPVDIRRRNMIPDDAYPHVTATGMPFEGLSLHAALDTLIAAMDYHVLRDEQAALRKENVYRGIGISNFVEGTTPSPTVYGEGGVPITAQDACTVRLEPTGDVTCLVGVTEQGQGATAMMGQVVAGAVGVPMDAVKVIMGDTDVTPHGGGTWASRATGIAGEAGLRAGRALRDNILKIAGALLQADSETLDIVDGTVVARSDGAARMTLREIGRMVHFRGTGLPVDTEPGVVVTRHYSLKDVPFLYTNGVMGSHVEVDPETGFVTLLGFWVVDDCGTIVNPQLVDEQIRGGVVQGIGSALYEECQYDADGQLLNGSLADYLVPMAGEMPDIKIAHLSTPTGHTALGAKGVGEAGNIGATGAVLNAINNALAPFDTWICEQPATPMRILEALGKI